MKRLLSVVLLLICLMALFCPVFAVVECKMPEDLPGVKSDVAVHDVLIIGGTPEENTAPDAPVQDVPADGMALGGMIDGKYATMGDLYQAWGGYAGYPDYVCGVWSTDGGMTRMTVAVTDDEAGEKGRQEILAMLANPETVVFTTQKYSYRELQKVMDEITVQMGGDSPIVACGVYEMENKVHVTVNREHEAAGGALSALTAQYGDLILVEEGEMIYDTLALVTDTPPEQMAVDLTAKPSIGNYFPLILLLTVLVLAALTVAFKLPARVTNTGKVITEGKPTRAQVEAALAEHSETPPDRVEERLKKKL